MRAVLLYNLDQPDDKEAHLRAIKSTDLALALFDIREKLFKLHETVQDSFYTERESNTEQVSIENRFLAKMEQVQEILVQALEKYDINLDEMLS